MLDAGAGEAPYAPLFGRHRYETADFNAVDKPYGEQTYVCDLASIPVAKDRYDLVLLSQVLEHLPEPDAVLDELARVLKPGGHLWLSAPLIYEEHEQPYDFYRYTQFGLRRLVEDSGLDVETIDWLEGYLGTLGYELRMAGMTLPVGRAEYGGGWRGIVGATCGRVARPLATRAGWWLDECDRRYRFTDRGMPKNYTVVAVKPRAARRRFGAAVGSAPARAAGDRR